MFKLVTLDLDGTALNSNREITKETLETLKKLSQNGINVIPNTGRIKGLIPEEILAIKGLDYLVTCNGAQIFDLTTNSPVYENPIRPKQLKEVQNILAPYDSLLHYYINEDTYILDSYKKRLSEFMAPDLVDLFYNNSIFVEEVTLKEILKNQAPLKIDYRIKNISPHEKQEIFNSIKGLDNIEIITQEDGACEITHKNSIKGRALKILSEKLNIVPSEIVAIGDSLNDLSMLDFAGTGIAMRQSNPELKLIADIVTDTNDNEGVSKIINSLFQF